MAVGSYELAGESAGVERGRVIRETGWAGKGGGGEERREGRRE
jgi:hypothetical protein